MESSTTNTDLTRKQLLEQFKLAASSRYVCSRNLNNQIAWCRSHEKIVRYGTELLTLEHQAKKLGQTDLGDESEYFGNGTNVYVFIHYRMVNLGTCLD